MPPGFELYLRGTSTILGDRVISIAASPFFNAGTVSVQGSVTVTMVDGRVPVVTGSLPGTMSFSLDGQVIGTLSRSQGGVTTISGDVTSLVWPEWDSGTITNAHAKTFTLFLLPMQAPNYFYNQASIDSQGSTIYDFSGTQKYADLCIAAGLRTVSYPKPYSGQALVPGSLCTQFDCMLLVSQYHGGLDSSDEAYWGENFVDIQDGGGHALVTIPWNHVIVHGPTGKAINDQGQSNGWDSSLHPICGLEHEQSATSGR